MGAKKGECQPQAAGRDERMGRPKSLHDCHRIHWAEAYRDLPPVAGETLKQQERRERFNRINEYLRQLRRSGTVDHAAIYGTRAATVLCVPGQGGPDATLSEVPEACDHEGPPAEQG